MNKRRRIIRNAPESKTKPLQELFNKEDSMFIPIYQRDYSWDNKPSLTLFDDLHRFYEKQKKDKKNNQIYFLGNILLFKNHNENRTEIVDGQQRLITMYILFNAIKIKLEEINISINKNINSEIKVSNIQDNFSLTNDQMDNLTIAKLKTIETLDEIKNISTFIFSNSHQHDAFTLLSTHTHKEVTHKKNKSNFLNNFNKLYYRLNEKFAKKNSSYSKGISALKLSIEAIEICEFYKIIYKSIYLNIIELTSEKDAWRVFVDINSTGLELKESDIIKSVWTKKYAEQDLMSFSTLWDDLKYSINQSAKNDEGLLTEKNVNRLDAFLRYYVIILKKSAVSSKQMTEELTSVNLEINTIDTYMEDFNKLKHIYIILFHYKLSWFRNPKWLKSRMDYITNLSAIKNLEIKDINNYNENISDLTDKYKLINPENFIKENIKLMVYILKLINLEQANCYFFQIFKTMQTYEFSTKTKDEKDIFIQNSFRIIKYSIAKFFIEKTSASEMRDKYSTIFNYIKGDYIYKLNTTQPIDEHVTNTMKNTKEYIKMSFIIDEKIFFTSLKYKIKAFKSLSYLISFVNDLISSKTNFNNLSETSVCETISTIFEKNKNTKDDNLFLKLEEWKKESDNPFINIENKDIYKLQIKTFINWLNE